MRSFWLKTLCIGFTMMLLAIVGLALAVRLAPFDEAKLANLDVSTVVYDRDGQFLRAYLSDDERWRIPAKLAMVSPWTIKATLSAEDKRFYAHGGIDYLAILRATWINLKARRIVSGASTITMQVAGFAIESRERTLRRKLSQAFLALQLEYHWSKQRILECYLTHASYGGNVCGVEAASRRYFNKTAAQMSVGESALLAGVPQSPERFRPDRHLKAAMKRREYVLAQLRDQKLIEQNDYERIQKLKVLVGTYEVPVLAPHFCDLVRSQDQKNRNIVTTLKLDVQLTAENAIRKAVERARRAGVTNGAVVVLDNTKAEVLAMVGSVDYWNRFDDGQVNGALGFRSPGSVLKPLIFGEAFDKGLLEPDEILFDVPVTIGGYSPVNYDRKFRGPVTAAKALAWSLNIPAMEVLNRIGVGEFQEKVRRQGIPLEINSMGDTGLSLAIGTCSARLLDMTAAYASLAANGNVRSPAFFKEPQYPDRHRQWLSPESCHALLSILSDTDIRAPGDVSPHLSGLKNVAWKTGTSNGFRDAWTIAVTRNYTIGVWLGNMNGKSSRALVGGELAAPVALEIAQNLNRNSPSTLVKDDGMESKVACLETGLLPGPQCKHRTTARFLGGSHVNKLCQVHQWINVDPNTNSEICTLCANGNTYIRKSCAVYPAAVASWLRVNHHPWVDALQPAHNNQCKLARQNEAPVIVSPATGTEIILLDELPARFQMIELSARTARPYEELYWFVDDTLVSSGPAAESVQILPVVGRHRIRCVDKQGVASEGWFSVESESRAEKRTQVGKLGR